MSTLQSDVGRHSKVVLAGGAAALAAVCYLVYSYAAPNGPAQSNLGAIQTSHGAPVPESMHYGEVLQKYNLRNAAAASQAGESYLSVFSARPQAVPPPPPTEAAAVPTASEPPPSPAQQAIGAATQAPVPGTDGRAQQRLAEQGQALMNNWLAVPHTAARVSDAIAVTPAAAIQVAAPSMAPGADAAAPAPLVPGFTVVPAVLRTDIDTDETSTVEAQIATGPYAGAAVYAPGYKRMNNGVDMTFTQMAWNGRTYRIHARPIDQHTMRSALSGEVNNRYLSRILLPALALGLGRAGQLFEQADTQTIVTPIGGIIQTRSGTPSGRTIAGAVAGGIATETGQVLRSDAALLPVRQVLIARDETIGVRFIEPVYASDEFQPPQVRASSTAAPAAQ